MPRPYSDSGRITVILKPRAREAMERAAADQSESMTNVVNQALTRNGFLCAMEAQGWEVILRHRETGREQYVQFL